MNAIIDISGVEPQTERLRLAFRHIGLLDAAGTENLAGWIDWNYLA